MLFLVTDVWIIAKYCVLVVVEINTTKQRSSCLKVSFNGITNLKKKYYLRCAREKNRSNSLVALVWHSGFYGSFRVGVPGFFDVAHSLFFGVFGRAL